ncbi:MAG: hypothetical protein ABL907_22090 [Hyphomicrobium sp.]
MSDTVLAACRHLAVAATLIAAYPAIAAEQPAAAPAQSPAPAPTAAPAAPATGGIALELNKLEAYEKGCRAYMVLNNTSDLTYQSFKIEFVLFQSDGIIGRRFAFDLAPLKQQKKTVKLFDLDSVGCDKIGSFLINEVIECKSEAGAQNDCLQRLTTSTLTNVSISK